MAKFKITPTTTVAELKEQFRNEVGCVLRVYQGRSEAPDGATLVSLGAKEGELECRTSRTVGKFEEAFQNELNLKVKVYTKDNWVKVLDGITLAVAGQLPNGMTKAKMEEHLSYKRDEAETVEVVNEETSEEVDVNDGYDASVALAEATSSAAVVFHKFGDGYADDAEVLEDFKNSAECFFILLEKDGQFRLFRERVYDETKGPFGDYITFDITNEIEVSDAVYYSDKFNDIYMSDETEDTISRHSDYSLDNAIDDVLSGTNENEWPAIDVDFIYNGKVFYSFTL
mgnify:CR=1 FL=1